MRKTLDCANGPLTRFWTTSLPRPGLASRTRVSAIPEGAGCADAGNTAAEPTGFQHRALTQAPKIGCPVPQMSTEKATRTEHQSVTDSRSLRSAYELAALAGIVATVAAATAIAWDSLPFFMNSLSVPLSTVGLFFSANLAADLVVGIPAGAYADNYGRRVLVLSGLLVIGASLGFLAISHSAWQLAVFAFVEGLGFTLFTRGVVLRFYEAASERRKGVGTSLSSTFTAAGQAIGLAVVGLASFAGFSVLYLLLASAITLAAGGAAVAIPKTQASRFRVARGSTTPRSSFREWVTSPAQSFVLLRGDRVLQEILVIQVLLSLSWGSSLAFLSALGLEVGLELQQILLLFSGLGVLSMALSVLGGIVADKLRSTPLFVLRPVTAIVPMLVLALSTTPLHYTIGAVLVMTWNFTAPGNLAYTFSRFPQADRGKVDGLRTFAASVVGTVAPLLGAALWGISPSLVYLVAALPAIPALFVSFHVAASPRAGELSSPKQTLP